jgi:hypothetical protein
MIFNLLVIFVILLLGLYFIHISHGKISRQTNRKRYIKIISFILILQSGLRNWAVGADTYAYYLRFKDIFTISWTDIYKELVGFYTLGIGKDPGYDVFEKIVQYIIPNYQLFLMLIAVLFFTALGSFIYKNTSRISDAIFAFVLYSALFYSFFSITGIRQTIATAAALWSYEFLKQKKLMPFLLIIVIASTIHKSALIFIPFYFIANYLNPKLFFKLILLIFPLVMAYNSKITSFLIFISESKEYEQYGDYKGAETFTFTLMILIIALLTWWRMGNLLKLSGQNRYVITAFALALLFTPLTWVNPNLMRMVQYFSIFILLLIPMILKSLQFQSKNSASLLFVLALFLLFALFIKNGWSSQYEFFWQEMKLGDNYRNITMIQ